ncbi:chitosanase [Cohnella silvisoli]|uniref:Chitosanase n=1 Tax=Cohnella silvisoli TaxID=2873699 RepID=A0ABV1KW52_9BACL|nr:chitosanase [Cohnella silvisoli]MCD9023118.1 chitosanase [Cohnella silvisoli]
MLRKLYLLTVLTCLVMLTLSASTSAAAGLDAEYKARAEAITSVFENGTTELQYGYAENLNDGRGITSGRAGFTTGTGDAYVVVKRFTDLVPENPLAQYLSELERLNTASQKDDVSGLSGYIEAWRSLGNDSTFRQVQNDVVDEMYYGPSQVFADNLGLNLNLSRGQLYDAIIQHGSSADYSDSLPALINWTNERMGGTPASGVDEKDWMNAFLDVRRADLENAVDPATREEWKKSVGRVDVYKSIVADGNWDLNGPITINTPEWQVTVQ